MQNLSSQVIPTSQSILSKLLSTNLVIAIDGPAGAGKSTIALALTRRLNLYYLDTGALYRCLALKAFQEGMEDLEDIIFLARNLKIYYEDGNPQKVFLDNKEVTNKIRTLEISEKASAISVHSDVRRAMEVLQKRFVKNGKIVLEGRDTTTVIAPQADLKIYLTASLETRATRRFQEMKRKGQNVSLKEVTRMIKDRDQRDQNRNDSPLRIAEGALILETDLLTIDQAIEKILEALK